MKLNKLRIMVGNWFNHNSSFEQSQAAKAALNSVIAHIKEHAKEEIDADIMVRQLSCYEVHKVGWSEVKYNYGNGKLNMNEGALIYALHQGMDEEAKILVKVARIDRVAQWLVAKDARWENSIWFPQELDELGTMVGVTQAQQIVERFGKYAKDNELVRTKTKINKQTLNQAIPKVEQVKAGKPKPRM